MALANVTDQGKAQVLFGFSAQLAEETDLFTTIGNVRTDETKFLRIFEMVDTGDDQAWDGTNVQADIVINSIKGGDKIISPTKRLKGYQIAIEDWDDMTEQARVSIGAQIANHMAARVRDKFFTAFEALPSMAHPLAGAALGQVGAGKKFVDVDLVGNQTLGSAFTQSNLLSLAPSGDAIQLVRANLRAYRAYSGEKLLLGDGNLVVVCHPLYENLFKRFLNSPEYGIDRAVNPLYQWAKVVSYPFANPDRWYIIDRTRSPVGLWMRQAPQLKIVIDPINGQWMHFTTTERSALYTSMSEAGFFASIP